MFIILNIITKEMSHTYKKEVIYDWIEWAIELFDPHDVYYCTGTDDERQQFLKNMIEDGTLIKLNEELRPNSYLARSDPNDVARLESCTYVCTTDKNDAGPNNNWEDPNVMKHTLLKLMSKCMKGKTLYVIPFVMGRLYDEYSVYGIQLTDSPYVVVNMGIMTTMGTPVWEYIINNSCTLIKCLHTVASSNDGWTSTSGHPLSLKWESNPTKYICHFPETLEVFSYGSGYGGNALLGKKSIALRLASYIGSRKGWWAEHMLLIGVKTENNQTEDNQTENNQIENNQTQDDEQINENNETKYIAGCFPSATGKTNLALIKPALPGWKITTLGDDITWLRFQDNQLYGMNPETGFFGVCSNTSYKTNPHCMETITKNTIFTNVALTKEGDIWWDGLTEGIPEGLIDWKGQPYTGGYPAAHPNSRFTVSIKNCPLYNDKLNWVPISAILFGGKRKEAVPLVREALSWKHAVYMGATICSEQTAAAEGPVGLLRYDPFAMLPFCGYHMGQYFQHWINMNENFKVPKIFYVNWFKKDNEGKFLWPGFCQNIRVIEWIYNRINNNNNNDNNNDNNNSVYTPIGYIPKSLNLSGLKDIDYDKLFEVESQIWIKQMESDLQYLSQYNLYLPKELLEENNRMMTELDSLY